MRLLSCGTGIRRDMQESRSRSVQYGSAARLEKETEKEIGSAEREGKPYEGFKESGNRKDVEGNEGDDEAEKGGMWRWKRKSILLLPGSSVARKKRMWYW